MKLGATDLSGIVRQLSGETPELGTNVFGRSSATVTIGKQPYKGLGATAVSALLDLIRDLAIDARNEIEDEARAAEADDEDDD